MLCQVLYTNLLASEVCPRCVLTSTYESSFYTSPLLSVARRPPQKHTLVFDEIKPKLSYIKVPYTLFSVFFFYFSE